MSQSKTRLDPPETPLGSERPRRLVKGTAIAAAVGFVSAIGIAGLSEAEVNRVESDVQTLRAAAESGAQVSHPILESMTPISDSLRVICHSQSYSQSSGHNQSHGQTYDC